MVQHPTPGHPKKATAHPQEATEAPPCSDTHFPQPPTELTLFLQAGPQAPQITALRGHPTPLPPLGTALFTELWSLEEGPHHSPVGP